MPRVLFFKYVLFVYFVRPCFFDVLFVGSFSIFRHRTLCPEDKQLKTPKILEKYKRTRGNCEAEASPPKKKQNSEDPSGSIRDITAHLIHDKNTSIALSCTVFNFPSAGNDPRWIYWSYEFLFFSTPGTLDPEAGTDRTRRSKSGVPKVWPHDSMQFFTLISMENTRKS